MADGDVHVLTKVLATLGPATRGVEAVGRLIDEGTRCFRINFSHGSFDDFADALASVREASRQRGTPVAVLGDLSGPKIRLNEVRPDGSAPGETITLNAGDRVAFSPSEGVVERRPGESHVVASCTYARLIDEVKPGHRVLIDDGAVRLLATGYEEAAVDEGCSERRLVCAVTTPGVISTRKGINLPDTDLSLPSLTEYDAACARWAVEQGLDYLALSFVRRAEDLRELKRLLSSLGRHDAEMRSHSRLPIVAKIEKPEAIREMDGIIAEADAVMVARGDLGVEMPVEEVPMLQKRLVSRCHDYGKPVIVATQMLQSMIDSATPTRAEVSDVANAICDGADAVMLSGETAVGKHALAAVMTMARTARVVEGAMAGHRRVSTRPPQVTQASRYRTAALAHAVSTVVNDLGPRYVVCWSELGGTARYLAQNRLTVPVVALSSSEAALRRMSLHYGVLPCHMPRPAGPGEFIAAVDRLMLDRGWCEQGDALVLVKGDPLGTPGVTNELRIHYVGDVCRVAWQAKG